MSTFPTAKTMNIWSGPRKRSSIINTGKLRTLQAVLCQVKQVIPKVYQLHGQWPTKTPKHQSHCTVTQTRTACVAWPK